MGFTYTQVKEIKLLIKEYQDEYWAKREEYEWSDLDNILALEKLDEIIRKLKETASFESRLVDFTELKSDIEFIEEYYQIKRWPSVNRWLSNTKSTLLETHKSYINSLPKDARYRKSYNVN